MNGIDQKPDYAMVRLPLGPIRKGTFLSGCSVRPVCREACGAGWLSGLLCNPPMHGPRVVTALGRYSGAGLEIPPSSALGTTRDCLAGSMKGACEEEDGDPCSQALVLRPPWAMLMRADCGARGSWGFELRPLPESSGRYEGPRDTHGGLLPATESQHLSPLQTWMGVWFASSFCWTELVATPPDNESVNQFSLVQLLETPWTVARQAPLKSYDKPKQNIKKQRQIALPKKGLYNENYGFSSNGGCAGYDHLPPQASRVPIPHITVPVISQSIHQYPSLNCSPFHSRDRVTHELERRTVHSHPRDRLSFLSLKTGQVMRLDAQSGPPLLSLSALSLSLLIRHILSQLICTTTLKGKETIFIFQSTVSFFSYKKGHLSITETFYLRSRDCVCLVRLSFSLSAPSCNWGTFPSPQKRNPEFQDHVVDLWGWGWETSWDYSGDREGKKYVGKDGGGCAAWFDRCSRHNPTMGKELRQKFQDWTMRRCLRRPLPLPPLQGFLYRALGFTLATGLEADKVEVLLLELLYKTDYSDDFDREGVILCFGLCARGQVKTVLGVLHDFEERIQESEQSWQIGAWRKDHPWRRETVKGALMVMYSCVASYCHPQMLLIHVDNPITAKIIHHYSSSCQDICLKLAFMKSVVQVTNAIKNIKDLDDFQFAQKATLTGIIMAIIKAEPTDSLVSPVRTMAMDALSYLSKLKPFYSTEESNELMDISIHSVISLQPPGESNESIKTLYTNALCALEQLMEGLMQRHLDPKGLQEMVHLLEKWILSEKEWEREKAVNLHLHLMQIYVQSVGVCIPLKLGQFGSLVGLIAPGTCDSHRKTRLASMDVLASLLDLHASQTCSSWGACNELELEKCKEDLQGSDMEKILGVSSRISKVACLQFNCDEVVSLVQKLCENFGAVDLQHDKASVTWICTFLQMRVKELEDKVAEILGAILVHLPVVDHREVRRLLIEDILLLAHYHQETVLTALLRQPLPMESHLTEVWLAVAENVPFAWTMLHALMGRLQARFTPRANAASKADIWRLAAVDPLMTLSTIHLLVERIDWDNRLLDLFPDLVYTLLLQLGGSQGQEAVSPVLKTWRLIHTGTLPEEVNLQRCGVVRLVTIRSMQLLFRRLNGESLLCTLEEQGVWRLLESSSTFLQGVSQLARLCVRSPEGYYRQRLSELALRGMASEALSCRISSTAVCVEFMSDPILHQKKLLKRAVLMLEKGAEQEDEVLRVLSLRALGNMALGAPRKVRQYRKLLLEKCLSSLRGPGVSTSVTSEGLEVLAKVLVELREGDLGSTFKAISEQCRAFFDNESELLRLKAFILFGKLAQVVRISKKHFFKQEVKKAWVPLMLHCQDPCSNAAQACVATLFQCVHFWGWRALESSADHSDATALKEMAGFQMTLCSVLTQKKPAVLYNFLLETMTYVKSNLSRIRIAACNLAGIIMKQMSAHYLKKLDFPALRNSLQELQLDSDPGVWRAALETLNILDTCSQQRLLASPEGIA
ncbi:hypothetical protein FD755_003129 [Muntiacus reevesi]|uniref:Maestro heat-like repeat-containing protein family member 2A n=1 Tax=Muntiacus reevesi TaxID=9886 RepID=A0A5J5N873_MUNRE|nr:hypothetical protein FD755_003129 [Muntiacus reevesi]